MVRSGRLQWLIQADRADLGPAVTGYLFDADCIQQNSKQQAYNYTDAEGVRASALEVISRKSGFAFTAFGQQTRVRWVREGGVPTVEATWWADGVRVVERYVGMTENNTIRRSISLTGANLHGDEQYTIRLRLPGGKATTAGRALWYTHRNCPQALLVTGDLRLAADAALGVLSVGPVTVSPGTTVTIDSYLLAQIPANTQTVKDLRKQIDRVANDAGRLLQATHNRWATSSRIETDDALVREVFNNTASVLPAIASDQGKVRVGPFQYPAEWVRDNSQFSRG